MGNDILIVVDVQNGFVNSHSEHVVSPIASFVEHWLSKEKLVVLTRFHNSQGSKWESLIHWTRLRTSREVDLVVQLDSILQEANKSSYLIADKLSYSSLTDEVRKFIAKHDAERVYICGIATDGCVLKTAVDVFEDGNLIPFVLSDLVASHAGDEIHKEGLDLISRFIGKDQVIKSSEIQPL